MIAGGGLAAQRCAETLRRVGYEGRIRIVCAERAPALRPPAALQGGAGRTPTPRRRSRFRAADWYRGEGASSCSSASPRAASTPTARRLELADGSTLGYEQLVIATGARAAHAARVRRRTTTSARCARSTTRERCASCWRRASAAADRRRRLHRPGGGRRGARRTAPRSTVIEAEPLPLHGLLGREVGEWFAQLHREEGVELVLGQTVAEIHGEGRIEAVTLDDGAAHRRRPRARRDRRRAPTSAGLAGSGLPLDGIPTDAGGRSDAAGRLRRRATPPPSTTPSSGATC